MLDGIRLLVDVLLFQEASLGEEGVVVYHLSLNGTINGNLRFLEGRTQ